MKRFIYLVGLGLLACSPCWATWTLTQVKGNSACNSPCAVTVTSTGSSHLLVAGLIGPTTTTTISSVTSAACSATWTHAPNSSGGVTGAGSVDLFYCTNSASAQTSISITAGGGGCGSAQCIGVIWEASSTLGNIAIDSGATPSSTKSDTTCTSCSGTSLTLSGNNDFIAALAACGGSGTGLTGTGWTNDLANPSTDGVGHGITSGSQTAPATWTQSSGVLFADAAAFQESSGGGGGGVAGFNKRQKLCKLDETLC